MSEVIKRLPDELFQINDTDKQIEAQISSGYIPERWLRIETEESKRRKETLEIALQNRISTWTEKKLGVRAEMLEKHWDSEMLPPSFPGGPYAIHSWLNFYEFLPRIINIKVDAGLVPDKDVRITFSSGAFNNEGVILDLLKDKVQATLGKENQLTKVQLRDCFTNISQAQLNILSKEIVKSGLTIFSETFHERFIRLVNKSH